ncbi:hypothetical protein LOK49_LG15G01215 [Camellia lanceoleosa]|uniref:Uncharacterized protein n=1 Tax=Camellia lanceoleosa TaxID=1840588 RepID=A0ACC0F3E6_9ERIC|nr:hypothetical protein LOK49_LG15G01215 [Camellia lanceoleosa]
MIPTQIVEACLVSMKGIESTGGLFETEEDEFEDEFLKFSADFFLQIMQMPSPSQGRLLECAIEEGEADWIVDPGGAEVCDGGGAQEGVGGEGVVEKLKIHVKGIHYVDKLHE